MKILVINGVNMNMLGTREPERYGTMTPKDLEKELYAFAFAQNIELEMFQSNFEGKIVEKIHAARGVFDGIVINAGAYTHTSIAIRDALVAAGVAAVEVHMTNLYAREEFRHKSYIAPVCIGQISGFGAESYKLGIRALLNNLSKPE
jgi:3-dehydroquinate dehydratase-2